MPVVGEIDMNAPAALVVAWRAGRNAHGAELKSGVHVTDALRENARESLNVIASAPERPYNPDDEQDEEYPVLSASQEELLDTALLEIVLTGSSLPLITPAELRKREIALYALLVGDDPESRAVFARKGNPVSLAGKSVVALFDRTLTRVTRPVLAFDSTFDLVLHGDSVWILNQNNFESIFRESEMVLAHTSEWVDQLHQVLPIEAGSKDWLATRLRQNSVLRRKIQSILRSSYLPILTAEMLRERMIDHGLAPERLMRDDALVFDRDTEKEILLILNEDLWTGDFSGDQYAAARKARRHT
jgi:hypothetical protein